jgi:hypothetical protein
MANSNVKVRREKVDKIMEILRAVYFNEDYEEQGVKFEVLISKLCLEFGSGRRYMKEIITDLENCKNIVIKDGIVYWAEDVKQKKIEITNEELLEFG